MPEAKTGEEAKQLLCNWIKEQGYKDEVLFIADPKMLGKKWELQIIKPYGLFLVDSKTGEVKDDYGTFSK